MKKQKTENCWESNTHGITLVALIITIIVMLILAGVAISMVVGENGVLNQAQGAGKKQSYASAKEQIELSRTYITEGIDVGKIDLTTTQKNIEALKSDNTIYYDSCSIVEKDGKKAIEVVVEKDEEPVYIYGVVIEKKLNKWQQMGLTTNLLQYGKKYTYFDEEANKTYFIKLNEDGSVEETYTTLDSETVDTYWKSGYLVIDENSVIFMDPSDEDFKYVVTSDGIEVLNQNHEGEEWRFEYVLK